MSLTKERSFYLDNVKSVLIFFVVIGHFAEVAVSHSDIFKSLFLWLYTFHMPLFIFITGYLSKNLINNKERVLKKSFEYFTLYFFLKIFIFFTRYFAEGHKTFYILKESSVPWYLLAISIMILASYFLRNINPKVILVLSIILALFAGYDKTVGDFLALSRTLVFFPFFYLGLICDEQHLKRIANNKKIAFIGLIIILITLLFTILNVDLVYNLRPLLTARNSYKELKAELVMYGPLLRLLVYFIGSILSVSFLAVIPKCNLGYFSTIGKNTLQIYFYHRPILWIIIGLGVDKWLQSTFGSFLGNVSWLAISIALTLLLSLSVLGKPFKMWNNFLFNNN